MEKSLSEIKKYSENDIKNFISRKEHPVLISFNSPSEENQIITVPVWTYFFEEKFYIFTGDKSLKVKAIKKGLHNFGLIIVDKNSFPDVYSSKIPYISISGLARIVTNKEDTNIPKIYLKLLEKYNYEEAPDWVDNLIIEIKNNPDNTWLIEITPKKYFVFNE